MSNNSAFPAERSLFDREKSIARFGTGVEHDLLLADERQWVSRDFRRCGLRKLNLSIVNLKVAARAILPARRSKLRPNNRNGVATDIASVRARVVCHDSGALIEHGDDPRYMTAGTAAERVTCAPLHNHCTGFRPDMGKHSPMQREIKLRAKPEEGSLSRTAVIAPYGAAAMCGVRGRDTEADSKDRDEKFHHWEYPFSVAEG